LLETSKCIGFLLLSTGLVGFELGKFTLMVLTFAAKMIYDGASWLPIAKQSLVEELEVKTIMGSL
jgi:hypothetical protein